MKIKLFNINDLKESFNEYIETNVHIIDYKGNELSKICKRIKVDDVLPNECILISNNLYRIIHTEVTQDGRETYIHIEKHTNDISYIKVNDGFYYINIYHDRLRQIECVYYPDQDKWYMYCKYDNGDIIISLDVKQLNNSEFKYLLRLIDRTLNLKTFIFYLVSTGYKGCCRDSLYSNDLNVLVRDEISERIYKNLTEMSFETTSLYEYL